MEQKKNIKADEADTVLGKHVYVLVCDWSDRHGESDVNEPKAFNTLAKARKALADDVVAYVDQFGGWDEASGKLINEVIYDINYEDLDELDTKEKLHKYASKRSSMFINQDDNGTYANWSIHRVKVE